MGLNPGTTK